ncbi:MAG: PIN domain-containing protein [Rhizobacter sp.]|nr:PIN domain-containing protein [Chlorobiales bacterium]
MAENSPAKCFIDTNIWLYAFLETQDAQKSQAANSLVKTERKITISSQVINEICINLLRKAAFTEEQLRELITAFYAKYPVAELTKNVLLKGSELRRAYLFSFWDSLIVANALLSEATRLYSEDMQHGLVVENRLEIVNPFRA